MIKVELIKVLNLVDNGTLGYIYVWLSHHTIGLCSQEAIEAQLNSCLIAVLRVLLSRNCQLVIICFGILYSLDTSHVI